MISLELHQWADKVRAKYSKHWELNPPEARESYFKNIFDQMTFLVREAKIEDKINPWHMVAFAYFHGMFLWSSSYPLLSFNLLLTSDCELIAEALGEVGNPERELVARACIELTKDVSEGYDSLFSDLAASTMFIPLNDRVLKASIARAVVETHLQVKTGEDDSKDILNTMLVVAKNFGSKSSSVYPSVFTAAYKDTLELYAKHFDALTVEDVVKIIEGHDFDLKLLNE